MCNSVVFFLILHHHLIIINIIHTIPQIGPREFRIRLQVILLPHLLHGLLYVQLRESLSGILHNGLVGITNTLADLHISVHINVHLM